MNIIIGKKSLRSRNLILLIKLVFVPAAFGWLLTQYIDYKQVFLLSFDSWLLLAALLVNFLALLLFATRMRIILDVFDAKISLFQAFRIHLQSMFYFFILPMTVGLEAARFAKVKKIIDRPLNEITLGSALLFDRFIGAGTALFLSLLLFPFLNFKMKIEWNAWLLLGIFILALGFIWLLFLHSKIRYYIKKIFMLCHLGQKGLLFATEVSIVTHIFYAFSLYLAAKSVHLDISFLQTLFALTAAMLCLIFPISLAGASPVEAATLGVLLALKIPMDQALIFVLLSYLAKFMAALLGGIWEFYEDSEAVFRRLLAKR